MNSRPILQTEDSQETAFDPKKFEFQNIFEKFESDPLNGLINSEVEFRQKKFGFNKIEVKKRKNILLRILDEFKDVMVIILIIAATIALLTNEVTDATLIFIVVIINGLIGFIQKFKAERAIEALKKIISPQARVIRNNNHQQLVDTSLLVPGDILVLNEGDTITADAIVFESNDLQIQESILTGESTPVKKISFNYHDPDAVSSAENFIFKGTCVSRGNCKALIVRTGMNTEFGKIADLTQATKKDLSPLEKELKIIGAFTAKVIVSICLIIFIVETFFRKGQLIDTIIFAISLAVAAVPEGLPATITIALALGVQRLSRKNAIVKQLSSVETLGATTVICSDKTGTLTKNQMTVTNAYLDNAFLEFDSVGGYEPKGRIFFVKDNKLVFEYQEGLDQKQNLENLAVKENIIYKSVEWLSIISLLCNNAELIQKDRNYEILGDPTEGALITMANKFGFDLQIAKQTFEKIYELPFSSERKLMSQIVFNKQNKKYYALIKGAPGIIINNSDQRIHFGKVSLLNQNHKTELLDLVDDYAINALRTIGFAYKEISEHLVNQIQNNNDFRRNAELIENQLTFIGIVGMIDPPREGVKEAVELTKKAGIKTYILTGDHGLTAAAIAEQIGLIDQHHPHEIITGQELSELSDQQLLEKFQDKNIDIIFSRISPEHKLRIVSLLKENGEIVAVTGDGVNDAPALKRSDIGIAMGISGTDVSKEAANMVLADDSYSTIVTAIKEGRTIYENLRKFIFYIFSSNIGEVVAIFGCIIIGLGSPLSAVLILTVNLATDLLPALALGVEPGEKHIMNKPPRRPDFKIMNKNFIRRFIIIGFFIGIIMIGLFAHILFSSGWQYGTAISADLLSKATSMVFAALVIIQIANAFNAKSESTSVFTMNHFKNPKLIIANLSSILICFVIIQVPFFQFYFKTIGLDFTEWLTIFGSSILIIFIEEFYKIFVRHKIKHGQSSVS
jgi:P-type Ca2+ transporter type 2C